MPRRRTWHFSRSDRVWAPTVLSLAVPALCWPQLRCHDSCVVTIDSTSALPPTRCHLKTLPWTWSAWRVASRKLLLVIAAGGGARGLLGRQAPGMLLRCQRLDVAGR